MEVIDPSDCILSERNFQDSINVLSVFSFPELDAFAEGADDDGDAFFVGDEGDADSRYYLFQRSFTFLMQ